MVYVPVFAGETDTIVHVLLVTFASRHCVANYGAPLQVRESQHQLLRVGENGLILWSICTLIRGICVAKATITLGTEGSRVSKYCT